MTQSGKGAKVKVLGHHDPAGGAPAGDVVAHRGFAYLGSWGFFTENGEFCRANGVRVYSLHNPRNPRPVATFADGTSNTLLAGSWTEKVIVRKVHTRWFKGDLAAVSFQDCRPGGFTGIGLYDVSKPRSPNCSRSGRAGSSACTSCGSSRAEGRPTSTRRPSSMRSSRKTRERTRTQSTPSSASSTSPIRGTRCRWAIGAPGATRACSPPPGRARFPFNLVHSVVVFKKIAYVSYWDYGTVMLDVSDPSDPEFLGRTEFAPNQEGNAHSAWVARRGKILIQADEDFDPTPNPATETGWGYGHIYDIRDKSNPVELATLKLPSTTQFPPPGAR